MKSIFWVFSLALTCFASGVSVFTLDEQYTSSNMTALRFKVVNNTGKSLKNVELHYKVVQKTGNIAPPDIYFLPSGSASWKQIDGVQTLVVKFPNVTLATGKRIVLHQNTIFTWVPYSPSVYENAALKAALFYLMRIVCVAACLDPFTRIMYCP